MKTTTDITRIREALNAKLVQANTARSVAIDNYQAMFGAHDPRTVAKVQEAMQLLGEADKLWAQFHAATHDALVAAYRTEDGQPNYRAG